ncbi:N-acetylglucosamine kinase [Limibacter armeniacum]|uniref:N-acetylglucosamine kinase n=1 Tax=Limibacter armeniacum TaxID=466084 RepID=UPI002FE6694B
MMLIADSGSTKTDWVCVDKGKVVMNYKTCGLNPYFLSLDEMVALIQKELLAGGNVDTPEAIHFYGAGCGAKEKELLVHSALQQAIPQARYIEVSGDMLGAARSLFGMTDGIACILGTGANSCVYKEGKIISNVPSLGYILADWGSGAVLGKDLVAALLQEQLPSEVLEDFYDTYQMTRPYILDRVYRSPMPNRFLASFVPFLLKHQAHPILQALIRDNFSRFFDYYVLQYKEAGEGLEVRCVGSVAYYFQDLFRQVADEKGINLAGVEQTPIQSLVRYHGVQSKQVS